MKDQTTKKISDALFVLWAGGGVLFSYFLVYALRKAFTASTFAGYELWGFDYKIILSISQILGYTLAKFCGIKIVSELKRNHRLPAIIISAVGAELALVLFGIIPYPYNFTCLFFNGLFLGSMWGFLFVYIEGRRLTDILASILGVSIVISSGAAKSFGLFVLNLGVSPFWMPAVIGGIAMPLLIFMGCLLNRLPDPSEQEKKDKVERVSLDGKQRIALFRKYALLLVPLLLVNILYTVLRDVKEDFLVDILAHMNIHLTSFLFVRVDSVVTALLLITFGSMIRIKDNKKALSFLLILVLIGSVIVLFTTLLAKSLTAVPVLWLFLQSLGIYTAYLAFQTVFFDRLIACFRISGNVGFFFYLSDFLGYLFSCIMLLSKTFFDAQINWLQYYNVLAVSVSLIGIVGILVAFLMMKREHKKEEIDYELKLSTL